MKRANRLPIISLGLILSVPLVWLACGGESKPAESPANENAAGSAEPAASESPAASASAAPAAEATPAPAPTPEPEKSTPPPPSLGSTDCGKCIDKTCAKQAAACGKDTDCQSSVDSIHSCSQGGAACLDSASAPSAAKAKKLAAAFQTCGKNALKKACKAKCQ
jgi:hypothetical protein